MQDIFLWIIISLCVIWAGITVYRRMSGHGKNPCGACSLRENCNAKREPFHGEDSSEVPEKCTRHPHHHRHHHE